MSITSISGDRGDAAGAVGLDEILENREAVVIVEWAERLKRDFPDVKVIEINIRGDGEDPRTIEISTESG
jgi:tRNA A37 threonylcarbamoyladenosine biosynthesis protein TsaE